MSSWVTLHRRQTSGRRQFLVTSALQQDQLILAGSTAYILLNLWCTMSSPAKLRRVARSNPHYGGFRVLLVLAALYTTNGQTPSTPALVPAPRPASALEVALTDNMSGVAASGANISSLPAQLYNFTSSFDTYTVPSNGLRVVGQGAYVGTAPPQPGASTAPFTFLQFTTGDSSFSPFIVPDGKMSTHMPTSKGGKPCHNPCATARVTPLCSCTTLYFGPSPFTALPSPTSTHEHTDPSLRSFLRVNSSCRTS